MRGENRMKKTLSIISILLILAIPCHSQDIDVAMVARYEEQFKTYTFSTDFSSAYPSEMMLFNSSSNTTPNAGVLTALEAHSTPGLSFINKPYQLKDGTIEFKVYSNSVYEYAGVAFRINGVKDYYRLLISGQYSPAISLVKVVNGTATALASNVAGTYNSWTAFKVILSGSSIKAYKDGNIIFDVTDGTFDKGYVGLMHTSASGGARFDDFSVNMTYIDDAYSGLIADDSGDVEDTGTAGYNRYFGSSNSSNLPKSYLCTRSGLITTLYMEQDASLDITNTNMVLGGMGGTLTSHVRVGTNGEGTNIGGNVSKYTLTKPMIVFKDYEYQLGLVTGDGSWTRLALPAAGYSVGASSSGAGPDDWNVGMGMGIAYSITSDYKLKMWAD